LNWPLIIEGKGRELCWTVGVGTPVLEFAVYSEFFS